MTPRNLTEFKKKLTKKGMNVTRVSTELRGHPVSHDIPKNVPHEVSEVGNTHIELTYPGLKEPRRLTLGSAAMWEFEDAPEVGDHAFYAVKSLPGGSLKSVFLIEDAEGLDGID